MEANIVCKICFIQTLLRSCINTLTFGANFIGNVVALYVANAFVVTLNFCWHEREHVLTN